jgi:hypothetical protein
MEFIVMKRFALAAALASSVLFASVGVANAGVIQNQMGMTGDYDADVVKAKVDGGVLTVAVVFKSASDKDVTVRYDWKNVYFIDKTENKKYHVLKDSTKAWVASPLYNGHSVYSKLKPGKKQMVWFKFPAPPASTKSIDLALPVTLPFDNLPVTH